MLSNVTVCWEKGLTVKSELHVYTIKDIFKSMFTHISKKTLNTRLSLKTFQPYDLFRFHKTAKKKMSSRFFKIFSFTGSLEKGSVFKAYFSLKDIYFNLEGNAVYSCF